MQKFRQTVSVSNKTREPERTFPLRIEPAEIAHLWQVQADPTLSTRTLASVTSTSPSSF